MDNISNRTQKSAWFLREISKGEVRVSRSFQGRYIMTWNVCHITWNQKYFGILDHFIYKKSIDMTVTQKGSTLPLCDWPQVRTPKTHIFCDTKNDGERFWSASCQSQNASWRGFYRIQWIFIGLPLWPYYPPYILSHTPKRNCLFFPWWGDNIWIPREIRTCHSCFTCVHERGHIHIWNLLCICHNTGYKTNPFMYP